MLCRNCFYEYDENLDFCPNCGRENPLKREKNKANPVREFNLNPKLFADDEEQSKSTAKEKLRPKRIARKPVPRPLKKQTQTEDKAKEQNKEKQAKTSEKTSSQPEKSKKESKTKETESKAAKPSKEQRESRSKAPEKKTDKKAKAAEKPVAATKHVNKKTVKETEPQENKKKEETAAKAKAEPKASKAKKETDKETTAAKKQQEAAPRKDTDTKEAKSKDKVDKVAPEKHKAEKAESETAEESKKDTKEVSKQVNTFFADFAAAYKQDVNRKAKSIEKGFKIATKYLDKFTGKLDKAIRTLIEKIKELNKNLNEKINAWIAKQKDKQSERQAKKAAAAQERADLAKQAKDLEARKAQNEAKYAEERAKTSTEFNLDEYRKEKAKEAELEENLDEDLAQYFSNNERSNIEKLLMTENLARKEEAKEDSSREAESTESTSDKNVFQRAAEWVLIRIRPVHVIVIAVVLVLIIAFAIYWNLSNPSRKFNKALEARNFSAAGQLYEDYLDSERKTKAANENLQLYIDDLLNNAVEGNTSYSATYSALEAIKATDLYQAEAKDILDKAQEKLLNLQEVDAYYATAVERQESLDYKNALKGFNKVEELYEGYKDTKERLAKVRGDYRDEINRKVTALQSQGEYAQVDEILAEALDLIPNDSLLESMRQNNKTQAQGSLYEDTSIEAERYYQSGKYEDVFKTIDAAIKESPDNESLKELKAQYETKCAESIVTSADNIYQNADIKTDQDDLEAKDRALEKIEEGLEVLPENKILLDAKERYEAESEELLDKKAQENQDDEEDDEKEEDGNTDDGLDRGTYEDVNGSEHDNAVLAQHEFTGDTSAVDTVKFTNTNDSDKFSGEIVIGAVDKYTQVYYQVYASSNPGSPVQSGTLYVDPNDVGQSYAVNVEAGGAEYYVVNLNYLAGGDIKVILDLSFKG